MLFIDFEADNEKDATQLALESLGLSKDDVKIEVLQKEKKGIFGLGSKEKAKIRVFYKEKSEINNVIEDIKKMITMIESRCNIEIHSSSDNKYIVAVESLDSSHLIGRNGKTMQAIQNIVNGILQKYDDKYKVLIDIDNYRERKHQHIVHQAIHAAKRVQRFKKPILLNPMNPYERRLVHMELKSLRGITTVSEGEGRIKRIKIANT